MPSKRMWLLAIGVVSMLLAWIFWIFWPGVPEPESASAEPIVEPRRAPERVPIEHAREAEPVARPEPAPAPQSAVREVDARLAALRGRLHVSCFVGEEFSGLRDVSDGWYSKIHGEWKGRVHIKDSDFDTQVLVAWDAPEGSESTACESEQMRWAEVSVQVKEELGGPARGVGVCGCGSCVETGEDGRSRFQVIAEHTCTLNIFRYAKTEEGEVYATAFHRLPALREHAQYELTVQLTDFEMEDGKVPLFDYTRDEAVEPGTSWVREFREDMPDEERRADVIERIAHNQTTLDHLSTMREDVSDGARALVDERIRDIHADTPGLQEWLAKVEDRLEEAGSE